VLIESTSFNNANCGSFAVTGSGSNYFEVTNASGVAETNVTLAGGYLKLVTAQTWTKPSGLKYAIVEVQGAGAAGGGNSGNSGSYGGGGGAYSKKMIAAATLGTTETVHVGPGGVGIVANDSDIFAGAISKFGSHLTAPGGSSPTGGTASGGDINISGQNGNPGGSQASTNVNFPSGFGGDSFLGRGGAGVPSGTDAAGNPGKGYGSGGSGASGDGSPNSLAGGDGAPGIIIVTEYYS
jgi:hypothetical protein